MNSENEMTLLYQSSRKMSDFAVGLIKGAAGYFNEEVIVEKELKDGDGEKVMLNIKKIG